VKQGKPRPTPDKANLSEFTGKEIEIRDSALGCLLADDLEGQVAIGDAANIGVTNINSFLRWEQCDSGIGRQVKFVDCPPLDRLPTVKSQLGHSIVNQLLAIGRKYHRIGIEHSIHCGTVGRGRHEVVCFYGVVGHVNHVYFVLRLASGSIAQRRQIVPLGATATEWTRPGTFKHCTVFDHLCDTTKSLNALTKSAKLPPETDGRADLIGSAKERQ
jgi:hypothetical protein